MAAKLIKKSTLDFLQTLSENNDRDWFNANKELYLSAHDNVCSFVDELILKMNQHDELESASGKKSLFRIYNDVRFSTDKSPYNARFAFNLQRATKFKRGGYYMLIKPGHCFLGCGFFSPNSEDLKTIRQDIDMNFEEWNEILNSTEIKTNFGEMNGEKLITAPRGFDKEHVAIDLIRHKQFVFRRNFTDEEVLAPDFLDKANSLFKSIRPFFDYMSDVLTTDANGESLI